MTVKRRSGLIVPDKYKNRTATPRTRMKLRYDIAETTPENRRHWEAADSLSADASASRYNRELIRSRARYEVANNTYARGIVNTRVLYVVGTGPKLQALTENAERNRQLENDFGSWALKVSLAEKLKTLTKAQTVDGEGFALLYSNKTLNHQVKLDVLPFECDRVCSPYTGHFDPRDIDGVYLDSRGDRPIKYRVLKDHPGGDLAYGYRVDDAEFFPAESIIHMFRQDRPGQHRGVSEMGPALPLFAQLRRYTLAVISAAEMAASMSGVFTSDMPMEDAEELPEPPFEDGDEINLRRNYWMFLPKGVKPFQMKAEQPMGEYKNFKHEIINEAARVFDMPLNIALCNSSEYNYASGRLDHQVFFKAISGIQTYINEYVLDERIFKTWLEEYALNNTWVLNLPEFQKYGTVPHVWFWDGYEEVDPSKEAKSLETRYQNKFITLSEIYAKRGKDWEKELRQYAREKELIKSLGLTEEDAIIIANEEEE